MSRSKRPDRVLTDTWCPECSKTLHATKARAKATIRRLPAHQGMREYPCQHREGWHIGHLPPVTTAGTKSAAQVYERTTK